MLSRRVCQACWREQSKGWQLVDGRRRVVNDEEIGAAMQYRERLWGNGHVNCGNEMDSMKRLDDGEVTNVPTELWAGDPLPKLPPDSAWPETIRARQVAKPPPPWCPFKVEHVLDAQ
jgi:hypothetical protein